VCVHVYVGVIMYILVFGTVRLRKVDLYQAGQTSH
jgi:hypothetical protein